MLALTAKDVKGILKLATEVIFLHRQKAECGRALPDHLPPPQPPSELFITCIQKGTVGT